MKEKKIRCFISLELPEEFIKEIIMIKKELEDQNLFKGKFTEEENIHLTLKFLGEIDKNQVEIVRSRLKEIDFDSFDVRLNKIGIFSQKIIRIIWLQLLGAELLQNTIDEALSDMFEKEKRFMSHITIARVKSLKDKKKLLDEINKIEVKDIKTRCNRFILKKSTLTPMGPVYETIEEYTLSH